MKCVFKRLAFANAQKARIIFHTVIYGQLCEFHHTNKSKFMLFICAGTEAELGINSNSLLLIFTFLKFKFYCCLSRKFRRKKLTSNIVHHNNYCWLLMIMVTNLKLSVNLITNMSLLQPNFKYSIIR